MALNICPECSEREALSYDNAARVWVCRACFLDPLASAKRYGIEKDFNWSNDEIHAYGNLRSDL